MSATSVLTIAQLRNHMLKIININLLMLVTTSHSHMDCRYLV